jgi:hypothetical protein
VDDVQTTGAAAAALGRVAPGFFQQAFVVGDLALAQRAGSEALGVARWNALPASTLPYRYRGEAVECALALAFGRSGNVQVELIQPVSGTGLHVDFLRDHGPGAHHLGFVVDDLDTETARAARAGVAVAMSGEFGRLRFAYLDTWAALGTYLELVEDPDATMMSLMPWR